MTSIGIPTYKAVKTETERRIVETNLRIIDQAVRLYVENGGTKKINPDISNPSTEGSVLIPDYLTGPIKGPGDAVYFLIGSTDPTSPEFDARAIVYSEKGVGGYVLDYLKSGEFYTIDNLPWNKK